MRVDNIRKLIAIFILLSFGIITIIIVIRSNKTKGKDYVFFPEGQSELHLIQTDGKKEIFELYAKRHYPDRLGRYHLSGNVNIKIFGKADGRDILIKGESGIYEKDLSIVTIHNSEVRIEDLKIDSKEMVYTSEGFIKSYSPAKFEHKYGMGEVESFIYDLTKKTISALNFKGNFKREENFEVSTKKITFSYNENSVLMEGNSSIKGEKFYLNSQKLYIVFSEGKIILFNGIGNSEIIYYGKGEGKKIPEIFEREGEKVLKCDNFEVERDGDEFIARFESKIEIKFPAKKNGETGSGGADLAKIIYEKEKGVREIEAKGNVFFIDTDQKFKGEKVYAKRAEELEEWELIKAEGKVEFHGDVSFECGNFSKNKNIFSLQNERPYVMRDKEIIYADRIEYDSEKKVLRGDGNVKAFLEPKNLSSTLPFFENDKKIFVRTNSIFMDENENSINLKGISSLEQGKQFLKGQDLIFEGKKGIFSAKKGAEFLFVKEDDIISGKCGSMDYSKEKNFMVLSGNSSLNTKDYSIKGETIKLSLDSDGKLSSIEGRKNVKFISREIEGEGDGFSLDLKAKKAILDGNPSVKDQKRGKMRGRSIFINLESKEIKIEGNVSEVEIKEKSQ
jgi:lipopolysaccharide export system protein LptA